MTTIWDSGISQILFLQSLGQWLTTPMKLFSFLGEEKFYLLIMPVLLWCVDARLGIRVGVLFLLSACLNNSLKLVLHAPRPFWINPQVVPYSYEDSFGIPSGHAQNSLAVWGLIALRAQRRWVWIVAVLLIFCISLSRIYLAVHFPTDILGGWLFGGLLLWAFHAWEDSLIAWFRQRALGQQILIAFLSSLALILLSVGTMQVLQSWQLPVEWVRNAALTKLSSEPLAPLSALGVIRPAGAFFGLAAGAAWLWHRGGLEVSGPLAQRVLRYVLGLIGVLVIAEGLGKLLPRDNTPLAYVLLYFRYVLVGLWITAGAPALFMRLRLAQPAHHVH